MAFGLRGPDGSPLRGTDAFRAGSGDGEFVTPNVFSFGNARVPTQSDAHSFRAVLFDLVVLPSNLGTHEHRVDSYVFVPPQHFSFTGANTPPGDHGLRATNYAFVPPQHYTYSSAATVGEQGTHGFRGSAYAFVPPQTYTYLSGVVAPGDHGLRASGYAFVPTQHYSYSAANTPPLEPGDHGRRVLNFAFGERTVHRGDAFFPPFLGGTTEQASGFAYVEPTVFFLGDAIAPNDGGSHSRRAQNYLKVTIESSGEIIGLAIPQSHGQRRPAVQEAVAFGEIAGRGRKTDFELSGIATLNGAGRKTDRQIMALGTAEGAGQRSSPPEVFGFGELEGFGQRRRDPELVGLAISATEGHRETTGLPSEVVGFGEMISTVPPAEMIAFASAELESPGQRLFPIHRIAPGWVKIAGREVEWSTEPPKVAKPLEVTLKANSAWYGPFNWNTYYDDFYPGDDGSWDGNGAKLLPLTSDSALFVYSRDLRWDPPADSPYYNNGYPYWLAPICARRLFMDETGNVASGPEIVLTGHPGVDGPVPSSDGPDYGWRTDPAYWTVSVVSTSPTQTRIVFRFHDADGYYDPYPGYQILWRTTVYNEYGYSSTGMLIFTFDWGTDTVVKGPFHRLGGPFGYKEEYRGGTVQTEGIPWSELWYENPIEYDYWGAGEGGDELIIAEMLTPTRGVTYYPNGQSWNELTVESFEVTGDTITTLDIFAFPGGYDPLERRYDHIDPYSGVSMVRLTATRFVIFGATDIDYQHYRWWSFELDSAGEILYHGAESLLHPNGAPWFDHGKMPMAKVWDDQILFFYSGESFNWAYDLWAVRVPQTGPPVSRMLLRSWELGHPDTLAVSQGKYYSYLSQVTLGSDGQGGWIAVWAGYQETAPYAAHLFGKGGYLTQGGTTVSTETIYLSDAASDDYYEWYWWSAFVGGQFWHGWLGDTYPASQYSIRTAVLELTGGEG